jgi:flagella basal body P-ring formation protein FlgA
MVKEIMLRLFALLILLGCTLSALPSLALEIELRDQVAIKGNTIGLHDIAQIKPDTTALCHPQDCIIAPAPTPGSSRTLSATDVLLKIQSQMGDIPVKLTGAAQTLVHREGTVIDKKKFQEIIAQYLQQNNDRLPQAEVRLLSLRTPADFTLPTGKLSWQVTPNKNEILTSTSFAIIFRVDGIILRTVTIKLKFEAMAEVATATGRLRKGTIIESEHITMRRMDIAGIPNPILDGKVLLGLQLKRSISAGKVIQTDYVVAPPVIRRGQPVKIYAKKGPLMLSTNGIAYSSGYLGDLIRVQNVDSNKLIFCRIASPGIVAVEF